MLLVQAKPDFSGHWVLVRSANLPAGTPVAIDVIESGSAPRTLSVTRHFDTGGAEAREYPVGVSGRVGGISVGGGIPKTLSIQSLKWDEGALLIDQEGDPDPERHERWSVNAEGELMIESADKPLVLATERVIVRYRRR